MASLKKGIIAILLFIVNYTCLAQTWIVWQNTGTVNGSGSGAAASTFKGTATLTSGKVVTITGVVSTPAISTNNWSVTTAEDNIAQYPIGSDLTADAKDMMLSRNSLLGISTSNILNFNHNSSARPNLITYTVSTSDGTPIKIDRFSMTDVDGLSTGGSRNYKTYDDSFQISSDITFSSYSLYSGLASDWTYFVPDTPPTVTNQSIYLPYVQDNGGAGKGVYVYESLLSNPIASSTSFSQQFTGSFSTRYRNGNKSNEAQALAIRVSDTAAPISQTCNGLPQPQFASTTNSTAVFNGVTVTRTLTRALYSPGDSGLSTTTYCKTNYPAGYAFIRSNDQTSKQSATYTFSTPQNSAQFFLMIMGNNQYGTANDSDQAVFSLQDDKGNTINNFTLSENPTTTDCHDKINIDNATHMVSTNATDKITSDGAIVVNSATPFKSVTVTDNRYNLPTGTNRNGGFGFYLEMCPYALSQACYRPANNTGTALQTIHGITALQRASGAATDWPGVIKGAHTALEAKTKGFVINRMASPETTIDKPTEGMMVFDTDDNGGEGCLKIYDGTKWSCLNTQTCGN